MNEQTPAQQPKKERNNGAIVAMCLFFVIGMTGMSYAAVPLYKIFCQVTGYGGTTRQVAQESDVILDKTIKVRFDGNVSDSLPWDFKPDQREIELRIGETKQVYFRAKNLFDKETTGQATFNVTPQAAGAYFNKIQCFCFTEQTLKPGEEKEMAVIFFVDPDIVNEPETKNINTLTLSYTVYPHAKTQGVAAVDDDKAAGKKL